MSSQERSDDSGEHGYGSTKQEGTFEEAEQANPGDDNDREDTVPSNKKRKEDADGDWPS